MEDTLRVSSTFGQPNIFGVLILVLMEDTLREKKIGSKIQKTYVLILVLMEDTLRETLPSIKANFDTGLNPCFGGFNVQMHYAAKL